MCVCVCKCDERVYVCVYVYSMDQYGYIRLSIFLNIAGMYFVFPVS